MPVFPLVTSRIVEPGRRSPRLSACSTMNRAMRSLMEPPGFMNSAFA